MIRRNPKDNLENPPEEVQPAIPSGRLKILIDGLTALLHHKIQYHDGLDMIYSDDVEKLLASVGINPKTGK